MPAYTTAPTLIGPEPGFGGTARFALARRIGAGGMGVVYEAIDRATHAHVALKRLRFFDAKSVGRFKKEFRSLHNIQHRNLVNLGELVEEGGQWFFTMELVHGQDILRYVRRPVRAPTAPIGTDDDTIDGDLVPLHGADRRAQRPGVTFHLRRLRDAFTQLVEGVAALHDGGKIHRDIKPQNVLVTDAGRVVLLDFGLVAEAASAYSDTEQLVGTAEYMAPEQTRLRGVTPAADWYSVGVMLYEALTGQVPFLGPILEILRDKQRREPPPPRVYNSAIPPELDALCGDLLHIDPAVRPGAGEILRRLAPKRRASVGTVAAVAVARPTENAPFVGRAAELQTLAAALARVGGGRAAAVCVHGGSGLGKSALLRHFATHTDPRHGQVAVLSGRCFERESVPFNGFDGVLEGLARLLRSLPDRDLAALLPRRASALPRVFPALGQIDLLTKPLRLGLPSEDVLELRHRAFVALRELLALLAERLRIILIIDDLQWADADSLLLLRELMRPGDAAPILCLLSSRVEPDRQALGLCELRTVELRALEPADARRLAALLCRRTNLTAEVSPMAIAVEAQGHPLFIDELVRYAAMTGTIAPARLRLEDAIWNRVSQLSPPLYGLVSLVASAGAPLEHETLRAAAAMSHADFARSTNLLRMLHLIRSSGAERADHIEVYHDRVREAVYARLSPGERTHSHARVAGALRHADGDTRCPELVIRHLEAGGDPASAAALAFAAGRRAQAELAFDRAAALYRTARRLGDFAAEATRSLHLALGDALAGAGHGYDAAGAYAAAAVGAEVRVRRECQRSRAEQLLVAGHVAEGVGALQEMLADVDARFPATPARAIAGLLWRRARLAVRGLTWRARTEGDVAADDLARVDAFAVAADGLAAIDTVRAADFQARALACALRLGEPRRVTEALAAEAGFAAALGDAARAQVLLAQAGALASKSADAALSARVDAIEAVIGFLAGDVAASVSGLAAAEARLRGQPRAAVLLCSNVRLLRLCALSITGRLGEMRRTVATYLGDADRRGDVYTAAATRRLGCLAWLASGMPARARAALDETPWLAPPGMFHIQHLYELEARVWLALYEGTAAAAADELGEGFARLRAARFDKIQIVRAKATWQRAQLDLAAAPQALDRERRLRQVARAARRLEREKVAYAQAWAGLLRAGIACQRGDAIGASARLRDVISVAEGAGLELCAAAARRRLGELRGGDAGAALIQEADAWLRGQGVQDLARMVEVVAPGFVYP
jgi:hypothetical protein